MKETTELLVAIFKSINSYILSRQDKKFDDKDLSYLLPLIFAWQAAIKDLVFFQESTKATPDKIDAMFNTTSAQELGALSPVARYKVKEAFKGAYIAYWSIAVPSYAAGALYAISKAKTQGGVEEVKAEIAQLLAA